MPVNKKQVVRMAKLVSELRQNKFPNTHSFAKRITEESEFSDSDMSCTPKTIQRDINALKKMGAPIEWDAAENGYRFRHQGWEFQCPLLEDAEVLGAILSAHVAETFFPEPMRGAIRGSVASKLTNNNPDFLDTMYVNTLIIGSGSKYEVDPVVFNTVFDAWQEHACLEISYKSPDKQRATTRRIEPHVLAFEKFRWYIKGIDREKEVPRLFAVDRVKKATKLENTFYPDPDIRRDVENNGVFSFEKISNVVVKCDQYYAELARERAHEFKSEIKDNRDGSVTVTYPKTVERDIIKWVLSSFGKSQIVEPDWLRKKVAKIAIDIARRHDAEV